MKRSIAKLLIVLLALNLTVINQSYTGILSVNSAPVLMDINTTGAVFQYGAEIAGTLYYVVAPISGPTLSAAEIQEISSAGAITLNVLATGSQEINPGINQLSIDSLEGCDGIPAEEPYTLWTTTLIDGQLGSPTNLNFSTLSFLEAPHVVHTTIDQIVVNCKLNADGTLYYGAYADATNVTAEDVINNIPVGGVSFNGSISTSHPEGYLAYSGSIPMTDGSGWALTIVFSELSSLTSYDLVFVRQDAFGNYSKTTYVINDAQTKGNKFIDAHLTYEDGQWIARYYFSEPILAEGDSTAYNLKMYSNSGTTYSTTLDGTPSATDNYVTIPITDQTFITAVSQEFAEYTNVPITFSVSSGAGILPAVIDNYPFELSSTLESSTMDNIYKPAMIGGYYTEAGADGPLDDSFSVLINMIPEGLSQNMQFNLPVCDDALQPFLWLEQDIDYTVQYDNYNTITFTFTESGADLLKNIPNAYLMPSLATDPHDLSPAVPYLYIRRDSSATELSTLTVDGRSVDNFVPNVFNYDTTIPYKIVNLYNNNVNNLLSGTPECSDSYVRYVQANAYSSGIIEVVAANGLVTSYSVAYTADLLTLGGILIDGRKPNQNFDFYAQEQTFSVSNPIEPLPTFEAIHASEVTATVISSPSAITTNTYEYYIELSNMESIATYLILVTYSALPPTDDGTPVTPPVDETPVTPPVDETPVTPPVDETPVTPPVDETPVTPPVDETPVTPPVDETPVTPPVDETPVTPPVDETPVTPPVDETPVTPPVDTTPDRVEVVVVPPTDSPNTDPQPVDNVISQPVTNLILELNNSKDSTTTFTSLNKVSQIIKQASSQISQSTAKDAASVKVLTGLVTDMTTKVEEKLAVVNNPNERLQILSQLMQEVQFFKTQVNQPTLTIDKSIEDMVQKTANAFGTIRLAESATGTIRVDTKTLETAIATQTEALKQLTQIQQTYFENSAPRIIQKELKIEAPISASQPKLNVALSADQVNTLKSANISALTISNSSAEIKMPMSNFTNAQEVALTIGQLKPQPSDSGSGTPDNTPQLIYEVSMNVNNQTVDQFKQPLTLNFSLTAFNLQSEAPETLAVYKLNPETGAWEAVGGIVDPESSSIFVTRDTLSQYTVLKSKKSFSDADQSWAKAEINAMLNKGIVSAADSFQPQALLTRGEFASWIAKAYGLKVTASSLPFKDVNATSEHYNAIAAAYQHGLLSGKSSSKFDPNGAISQNELAAAMSKLLVSFDKKEKSGKVTSKYLANLKTTQVASWAEDDMALLMELGFNATGSGETAVTKEAAAAAFMKFYRS